jgi:hypothetical protein
MNKKENNMICFEKVLEIHLLIEIFKVFLDLKIFFEDFEKDHQQEQLLDDLVLI